MSINDLYDPNNKKTPSLYPLNMAVRWIAFSERPIPLEDAEILYSVESEAEEAKNMYRKASRLLQIHLKDGDIKSYAHSYTLMPLYLSERSAQFYDGDSAQAVIDAIETTAEQNNIKPKLIVIDTLARNFGGGDENSTKDMNQFIQQVDRVKDQWDATVLIVHHTGHSDKSRARGAIALKGALDHEYKIQKDESGTITMSPKKTKDGTPPPEICFEITPLELVINETPANSAALKKIDQKFLIKKNKKKLTNQQRRALEIFYNCMNRYQKPRKIMQDMNSVRSVTIDQFKEFLKKYNISASDKPDSISKAISRSIENLTELGITATYENLIWPVDQADSQRQVEKVRKSKINSPDGQDKSL